MNTTENIIELHQILSKITDHQRLLGLDIGDRYIGLALSDITKTIATPMQTLQKTKLSNDIKILKQIIDEQNIGALIVGWPMNMNGTEGPRCQSVKDFTSELLNYISLPVAFFDERLSTVAADKAMLEADMSRKKRKKNIDKVAASIILQGALDKIRF